MQIFSELDFFNTPDMAPKIFILRQNNSKKSFNYTRYLRRRLHGGSLVELSEYTGI